MGDAKSYPARVSFERQAASSRLWAFLTIIPIKLIALIPHFIVLYFLGMLAGAATAATIILVLFTKKVPKVLSDVIIGIARWRWRIMTYFVCMTDKYPPLSFDKGLSYPADLDFDYQEESDRMWALLTIIPVKFIILIPHFIVLLVMSIVAAFCIFVGIWATLFMGRFPESFEKALIVIERYKLRIMVYVACLTDKYPPMDWD